MIRYIFQLRRGRKETQRDGLHSYKSCPDKCAATTGNDLRTIYEYEPVSYGYVRHDLSAQRLGKQ